MVKRKRLVTTPKKSKKKTKSKPKLKTLVNVGDKISIPGRLKGFVLRITKNLIRVQRWHPNLNERDITYVHGRVKQYVDGEFYVVTSDHAETIHINPIEVWRNELKTGNWVKVYMFKRTFRCYVKRREEDFIYVEPLGINYEFKLNVNSESISYIPKFHDKYVPFKPMGETPAQSEFMYAKVTNVDTPHEWSGNVIHWDKEFDLFLIKKWAYYAMESKYVWVSKEKLIDMHCELHCPEPMLNIKIGEMKIERTEIDMTITHSWERWMKFFGSGDNHVVLEDLRNALSYNIPHLGNTKLIALYSALDLMQNDMFQPRYPHFDLDSFRSSMDPVVDNVRKLQNNFIDLVAENLKKKPEAFDGTIDRVAFTLKHIHSFIGALRIHRYMHERRIFSVKLCEITDSHIDLEIYYHGEPGIATSPITSYRRKYLSMFTTTLASYFTGLPKKILPDLNIYSPNDITEKLFNKYQPWYDNDHYESPNIPLFDYQKVLSCR